MTDDITYEQWLTSTPEEREHAASERTAAPADVDPDEALAKVLYETYLRDTADEWDDEHPAVQEAWLRSARTAREHIESMGTDDPTFREAFIGGLDERAIELADTIDRAEKAEAERDEARASADSLAEDVVGQGIALTAEVEKWKARYAALAEAEVERLTREREWRNRYEALRSDVEEMRHDFDRGLWPDFKGVLARDTERGEQG